MNKNILITYSSKAGSTEEISNYIRKYMETSGADVEVKKIEEIKSIEPYQVIIVGSPIYMGRWLTSARKFIINHHKELQTKSVFFFSVGMSFDEKDPEKLAQIVKCTDKERELVQPIEEGFFLGRMDMIKLSLFNRIISKLVKAKNEDKRNWDDIKTWVDKILKIM